MVNLDTLRFLRKGPICKFYHICHYSKDKWENYLKTQNMKVNSEQFSNYNKSGNRRNIEIEICKIFSLYLYEHMIHISKRMDTEDTMLVVLLYGTTQIFTTILILNI